MKKTYSVNIAGRLFNIDEDAYFMLEDYLRRIEFGYANSAEGKEIKTDVEGRLSELFDSYKSSSTLIITIEDVRRATDIIGKPEDLGASRNAQYQYQGNQTKNETFTGKTTYAKRLYRDPDNRRIGGVCSGLAHYFDIDPVLLRILFLVFFFIGGFGFITYIIMWIALPKAKTPIQKIEMRGWAPTADNYKRFS
jgi:phage shock protein PspC (stress-responsive transcriptional regulator)